MSADLSRIRLNPLRDDYSATGLQQGRLLLDADYNEQVAITDRRLRAHVVDLAVTTPVVVSAATPDAFLLDWSGNTLTIGPGRMYVDGLLAENHGGEQLRFDPVLAETTGTGSVDYLAQPYWKPTQLPKTPGPHLAYLDVWDREVTAIEDPSLVEIAVGVDTTTRTQTVWQVRMVENVGERVACATPDKEIDGWSAVIARSGARLTTGTVPVDPADEPCELPPTGGYRGRENHLYRVQIYEGGTKPTFLWSRENASVCSSVVEILPGSTQLRLASIGKDNLLRINDDDWVEILDDRRELNQLPGDLRQVTVDEATNTISFGGPLSGFLVPTGVGDDTVAARHLRVRRWDSPLTTAPTDGTPVVLELGISVSFSLVDSGVARPGDFWVFAARTADASVEHLVAEPPRGVHHHYARLGIITIPGGVTDCRPKPPALSSGCGCEICVGPSDKPGAEAVIQQAIDAVVAAGGGTVSLCPGSYLLRRPILLRGAKSVRLTGHGSATVLISEGTAVLVHGSTDITLDRFAVKANGTGPGIALVGSAYCNVEEVIVNAPAGHEGPAATRAAIGLSSMVLRSAVRRCNLIAPVGVGVLADPSILSHGATDAKPAAGLFSTDLSIEDNVLDAGHRGVDLDGTIIHSGLTRITGNAVYGSTRAGIIATGLVRHLSTAVPGQPFAATVSPMDGVLEIAGNDVTVQHGQGIVTAADAMIRDNVVTARSRVAGDQGILVLPSPTETAGGHVQIIGNRITGPGGDGIRIEAAPASLLIMQNTVSGAGGGIAVTGPGRKDHVAVENNHILALAPPPADTDRTVVLSRAADLGPLPIGPIASRSVHGIAVGGAGSVAIVGNVVDGIAPSIGAGIGVMVVACTDARIHDNQVTRIGSDGTGESSHTMGIFVMAPGRSVSVNANTVHASDSPALTARPGWYALRIGFSVPGTQFAGAVLAGGVSLDGTWAFGPVAPGPVDVTGNTVVGGAELPAIEIAVAGEVRLRGNHSTQPPDAKAPAIAVAAPAAIVEGNRARGGHPSILLHVPLAAVLPIGNMTTADITAGTGGPGDPEVAGSTSGKAWSQLNSIVP
jgi:hypothetical protein